MALFQEVHKQGQTIVMVTHEEEYSHLSERIAYLDDGKIIKEEYLKQ
jgi:putative ABC transport system ATP-binding protein